MEYGSEPIRIKLLRRGKQVKMWWFLGPYNTASDMVSIDLISVGGGFAETGN